LLRGLAPPGKSVIQDGGESYSFLLLGELAKFIPPAVPPCAGPSTIRARCERQSGRRTDQLRTFKTFAPNVQYAPRRDDIHSLPGPLID